MTDNEIKLKAIGALTGVRSGIDADYVSSLLGEVTPAEFLVPADADAAEVGSAMLDQLSGPLSALISGFVLAFEAVADAFDRTGAEASAQEILQDLALRLASEAD
ncbi:hypothetical protein BCL76_11746 [Streptomyces sp. CG 926]|uniref:hypothetical protein n=1 Tax=unclassified Streptomyces TaxID=2593676 RepID=UPI000D6CA2FD|nr:hypothetical protein [Streptomyces sp. CG 926]PWK63969.1 hypothetical protein BCL76_11746 [Streptomyces sp. CG 926]